MLKVKKESCVFTIVKNEKFFLPIWLKYYKNHFENQDIYILNHQSDDDSLKDIDVNIIDIENDFFQDNNWLLNITQFYQKKFLENYENVLFTNIDEIIVPNKNYCSDLKTYIKKNKNNCVRCIGREFIHFKNHENNNFDQNKKITDQRIYYYENNNVYSKTLLSKIPLNWTYGWHNVKNNIEIDESLILFHLHRIDFLNCQQRHFSHTKKKWFKPDLEKNKWAWHFLIHDENEFFKWFYFIEGACVLNSEKYYNMFKQVMTKYSEKEIYSSAFEKVKKIEDFYIGCF